MIPAPFAPDPCSRCGLRVESRTQMRRHLWSEHKIPSKAANFDKEIERRRSIDVNREERRGSYGYSRQDALYDQQTTTTALQSYRNQNAIDTPSTTARHSYSNQDALNAPSTTAPHPRHSANNLAQSPQSYHSPQTKFRFSESYDPPSEIPALKPSPNPTYSPTTLPPDVAAVRLTRMNRDLIDACRTKPSFRHDQPVSFRGNGTYTHVASQNPQHYNEPVFLPLGGPNRCQPDRRVEAELLEEVNKAYEMLQRAMREEERLQAMGDTTDPRARYGALPKPPTTITQPLPPTETATTVDANRDPRLKRRPTDDVYGRR